MSRNAEEGDVVSGPWVRGPSCSKRVTQRDGAMWLPSALLLLSVPGERGWAGLGDNGVGQGW